MKKLILKIGALLLIGVASLFYTYSCQIKEEKSVPTPQRIIIKESTGHALTDINMYEIVEVDGIEYLTSSHGGIIALPKR